MLHSLGATPSPSLYWGTLATVRSSAHQALAKAAVLSSARSPSCSVAALSVTVGRLHFKPRHHVQLAEKTGVYMFLKCF